MRYLSKGVAAAVLALGLSAPLQAGLISVSSSAPVGAAISQPDFSAPAFDGGKDFTDNAGPPGQTFTPATSMLLSAITVKGFANTGASFGGNVNTGTWTLTIDQVIGGTTLTNLTQETADPSAITDGSSYVTFTLSAPVALVGGTQYAFDVYSSTGYFGLAKSSTDVYAGGAAIQHGSTSRTSATGATITNTQTVDRTFFVTSVPEPGSAGIFASLAGVLAFRRRRA